MDGSACDLPNSCNELTVPKANFPRNSDEESRKEVVDQNTEVSAYVHADVGTSSASVAKSVSSISPKRRPLPSFLQSKGHRTGPSDTGSTSEAIPLETLNTRGRHTYSGPLTDAVIQQLELELFTNNDRTVLSEYRTKQQNLEGEDALERIMTGEYDRDLQEPLNA